nr:unnamed protein product [Callosobruchus analis]
MFLFQISTAGVGILRKERCAKCNLPVFLAERLNVGKLHFHRTCLKCARCGSLLTVGNYYETESGDICCEVCPDEEKPTTQRLLLQRSMSDEEKTANLRTHCNEPDDYSTLFETALESVTSKALDEFTEARSQFIQSQMTSNSDSGNEENLCVTAPEVANSESVSKDVVGTINYDSGLPSVSDKFSHKFEETQYVTKDESDDVKLSQNKDILKHAEVELNNERTNTTKQSDSSNNNDLGISSKIIDSKHQMITSSEEVSKDPSDIEEVEQNERTSSTKQPDVSNNRDLGISSEIDFTKASNDTVETIDLTRDTEDNAEDSAFSCSEASESVIEISSSDVIVIDDSVTDASPVERSKEVETSYAEDEVLEKKTEDDYPTELNPFGEQDEENEESSTPPKGMKPMPVRRLKKILADEEDKCVFTPGKWYPKKISINPFEEDEDVQEPPIPVRRKRIPAPRISLNPFESEPEDSETIEEKEAPLPAPRSLEYPSQTPEAKPRSAHHCGTLSPSSRSGFGSNSSISSGSAPGSARCKKPAPRPPIPTFRYDESPGSSLTSSPSHSVHHSPRSTPKYRKSKKAPPPPPVTAASSTPAKDEEFAQNDLVCRKLFSNRISLSPIINETGEEANYGDDFEKEKLLKDEANRTRQGQEPSNIPSNLPVSPPDKSTTGKWKRRKGQAPTPPVIVRRTFKSLPMAEIKKELELIETQQQGLERQGVRIEKIIRQKCEGSEEDNPDADLPIEVEDLILQLFELVNEKNELFRKQTELMYLRRQQRLEEEHAEIEYQLRCLLHQPEANKTDSDKAREEQLLQRLIEVVEKRNDIVECLESDRIREVREDSSISDHINLYTTKRDEKSESERSTKEKEKKKLKKLKKLKLFKSDTVKHLNENESSADASQKQNATLKKEKKKFTLF